jgi:hypothetical protein
MNEATTTKGTTMKVTNAIKKLEKAGYTITNSGMIFVAARANSNRVIEFIRNGGSDEIAVIKVRGSGEANDPMTDYYCGSYANTITQAMRYA